MNRILKSIKYLNKISPTQFRCISPIHDTENVKQKEIRETNNFKNTSDSEF